MRRSRENEYRTKSESDNGMSGRGENNYERGNGLASKGGYGKGHEDHRPFGSSAPMAGGHRGPGPVEGAGEVVAGGPGRFSKRVSQGSDQAEYLGKQDMYKGSKEKTPKGMRVQDGADDE